MIKKINKIIHNSLKMYTKKELIFFRKLNMFATYIDFFSVLIWAMVGIKIMVILSGLLGIYCWMVVCITDNYMKNNK